MATLQYYGNNAIRTLQKYKTLVRHVYGNNSVGYQNVFYSICFHMVTQSTTLALIIEDYTFLIRNSNTDNQFTVLQTVVYMSISITVVYIAPVSNCYIAAV